MSKDKKKDIVAALRVLRSVCDAMASGGQDPHGSFAEARELCDQLSHLGGAAIGRALQRGDYLQDLLGRKTIPSLRSYLEAMDRASHIIDCAARPTSPNIGLGFGGGGVVSHDDSMGLVDLNLSKVGLYRSKEQQEGYYMKGSELHQLIKGQKALNANFLDFYLANPHEIPTELGGFEVYFWGTIYCSRNYDDRRSEKFIRRMFQETDWHSGRTWWTEGTHGIEDGRAAGFGPKDVAAILLS